MATKTLCLLLKQITNADYFFYLPEYLLLKVKHSNTICIKSKKMDALENIVSFTDFLTGPLFLDVVAPYYEFLPYRGCRQPMLWPSRNAYVLLLEEPYSVPTWMLFPAKNGHLRPFIPQLIHSNFCNSKVFIYSNKNSHNNVFTRSSVTFNPN